MRLGRQIAWVILAALLVVALILAILTFNRTAQTVAAEPGAPGETTVRQPEAQSEAPAETPPEPEDSPTPEKRGKEGELIYQSYGNGTCAVAGIGSFSESCLVIPRLSPAGDQVVKITSRAFFGCDRITVVQIPETVTEIGEGAFADCRNLVYLSVSSQNPAYCDVDGILFTLDRHCLIQYPPMRVGDPLVLPASVTSILEMAFYQCKNLKSVFYEGNGEDWDNIQIGSRNYGLIAASIRFLREE